MTENKRVDADDGFKKELTPPVVDPEYYQWPGWLQWFPGTKWRKYTWRGLSAIFSGMCIHSGLGIINIWGNLVGIFTSKFRGEDPHLSIKTTLVAFPLTYCVGAMAM
jgi:hypothetical protein